MPPEALQGGCGLRQREEVQASAEVRALCPGGQRHQPAVPRLMAVDPVRRMVAVPDRHHSATGERDRQLIHLCCSAPRCGAAAHSHPIAQDRAEQRYWVHGVFTLCQSCCCSLRRKASPVLVTGSARTFGVRLLTVTPGDCFAQFPSALHPGESLPISDLGIMSLLLLRAQGCHRSPSTSRPTSMERA